VTGTSSPLRSLNAGGRKLATSDLRSACSDTNDNAELTIAATV